MRAELPLFAELTVRGWFPVGAAVGLGAVAVVAVGLLYRREAGRLPVWRRGMLASVRVAALAGLLFLALRPTWVVTHQESKRRPVAVLVDESQSMTCRDPRPTFLDQWRVAIATDKVPPDRPLPAMQSTDELPAGLPEKPSRVELVRAAFTNPQLNLLKRLAEIGPLQPATVGTNRSSKDPGSDDWVKGLNAGEPRTALYDSLNGLLRRDPADLPAAVVLVTDGRDNSSRLGADEVARECGRLGVPVHVYGVGGSTAGQVVIRDVSVPDTLFVDDTVGVGVRFRVREAKDAKAEVTVKLNGREVARKVVDAPAGEVREVVPFVPVKKDAEAGRQELTTTVRLLVGADPPADELTKPVRVADRKVKVLVLDNLPRWEFKFVQRALRRDRRVDAAFLLLDGDRRAMTSGPPFVARFPVTRAELFAYDLLILGDLPATALTPEQQRAVREFVAEGGGLIAVAGRQHAPGSFAGTPVADVLPTDLLPGQQATGTLGRPYRPEPTPAGARSPLLRLDDEPEESKKVWAGLPELLWSAPVGRLKPAAEAYLVHPTDKTSDGSPVPLLAGHYYGKGYVLYAGFDESWRWRFNEADKYFARYWGQMVYAAGVPRTLGTKFAQLGLDKTDPQLGGTGQVYARLFSPALDPLTADRVEAKLTCLDAARGDPDRVTPVELRAVPGQPGDYVGPVPFSRVGRFALTVDTGAEPATLDYRVTLPPDHELAPGGVAEDDLRTLAAGSGGKFYREEDLHTLAGSIPPQSVPVARREERLLWDRWAFLAVLGLLTLEWVARKWNSLS